MKTLYLFLLLNICMLSLQAQKKTIICGKVQSSQSYSIKILEPLHSYQNVPSLDTFSKNASLVNGTDSVYQSFLINSPAFFTIVFLRDDNSFINLCDVLLFPGDSLNLNFNLSIDNASWIKYKGSNNEGQLLFNEINYIPMLSFGPY